MPHLRECFVVNGRVVEEGQVVLLSNGSIVAATRSMQNDSTIQIVGVSDFNVHVPGSVEVVDNLPGEPVLIDRLGALQAIEIERNPVGEIHIRETSGVEPASIEHVYGESPFRNAMIDIARLREQRRSRENELEGWTRVVPPDVINVTREVPADELGSGEPGHLIEAIKLLDKVKFHLDWSDLSNKKVSEFHRRVNALKKAIRHVTNSKYLTRQEELERQRSSQPKIITNKFAISDETGGNDAEKTTPAAPTA